MSDNINWQDQRHPRDDPPRAPTMLQGMGQPQLDPNAVPSIPPPADAVQPTQQQNPRPGPVMGLWPPPQPRQTALAHLNIPTVYVQGTGPHGLLRVGPVPPPNNAMLQGQVQIHNPSQNNIVPGGNVNILQQQQGIPQTQGGSSVGQQEQEQNVPRHGVSNFQQRMAAAGYGQGPFQFDNQEQHMGPVDPPQELGPQFHQPNMIPMGPDQTQDFEQYQQGAHEPFPYVQPDLFLHPVHPQSPLLEANFPRFEMTEIGLPSAGIWGGEANDITFPSDILESEERLMAMLFMTEPVHHMTGEGMEGGREAIESFDWGKQFESRQYGVRGSRSPEIPDSEAESESEEEDVVETAPAMEDVVMGDFATAMEEFTMKESFMEDITMENIPTRDFDITMVKFMRDERDMIVVASEPEPHNSLDSLSDPPSDLSELVGQPGSSRDRPGAIGGEALPKKKRCLLAKRDDGKK